MKNTVILFAFILGVSLLNSCEKDDPEYVLDMDEAVGPQFTNPVTGGSWELSEEEETNVLFAFEWSPADYQLAAAPDVRYLLQADLTANNWENPETIRDVVETRANVHEITVGGMNRLLTQMGIEPFDTGEVSFRLRAFLTRASEYTWLYSTPINLSITTYEQLVDPDILFVPGSWQGWDIDNTNTVLYSPDRDDLFEGYLYFSEPDTELKFATEEGWAENWGDDDGDGTLDPDGANILVADPGVYRVNVNLNALTYTVRKTEWALIGDAADGWDTDVFLEVDEEYFAETWKTRYKITRQMVPGFFKFRANANWDLNMGIDEDADEEGVLMYGGFGNDIPIETAGEYTIIFDLSGPLYTYEIIRE